jgi:hypothetical protein
VLGRGALFLGWLFGGGGGGGVWRPKKTLGIVTPQNRMLIPILRGQIIVNSFIHVLDLARDQETNKNERGG